MAESILYGLAQKVLKNLGSAALTDIASAWGFKTQLNKLKNTTNTLKDVLLDAEERQADSHAADSHAVRGWFERLSTVVYAADDLFDEFTTVAAWKQLKGGHKLTKEVCTFFSHSNQVALAFKISWKIKKIREELDDIEKEAKELEFVHRFPERGSGVRRRRDQTTSYVDEDEVVGRENDKKAILKMLLESSSTGHDEGLPVIPIVGMGGMGKTTLAQLIYNDPQVEYFDLRLWVCVSDDFDVKIIIDKLLKSATDNETPNLEMDQLESRWREEVANKKYLLVLDDVWNESRDEWLKLRKLLKNGQRGSKILVTTRSTKVAEIMSISCPYVLQELTEEKSWILFKKLAFKPGEAEKKPHLVEIGKEIVQKCGFVPLAIRTLGCLLHGQEERKWLSVRDTALAKIRDNQSGIMNILRLSYHHLWSPLKNCFAYCALFPKDYEFDKEMLKDLWIAEGFIVIDDEGQSLDEVAEEYFDTLLQRSFFQDIKKNEWEEIHKCKMHDLMHDLAQEVAGVKCKFAKSNERNFDEKCVHLSLAWEITPLWDEIQNSMLSMKLLRTFLLPEQTAQWSLLSKLISLLTRFRSLRVLDLSVLGLKSLPRSIGKLIHLRYLNLSETRIEKLPDSITDLWNLQTLRLHRCTELKTLPANMRKLTNLRCLDVFGCYELSHMPSGLGGLTLLNRLPVFIVGTAADQRYISTAKLSDVKNLNNLRGVLEIDIRCKSSEINMSQAREAELSNKHGLTELIIKLPHEFDCNYDEADDESDCKHDEAVLEGLEPPPQIKSLRIDDYRGENVPSWARMDNLCTTLPKLVKITLDGWNSCPQLPDFSQLPFLKSLSLGSMGRVEYIESVPSSSRFFPSLEQLILKNMRNVKGWWKQVKASVNENDTSDSASKKLAVAQQIPRTFSKLSKLCIDYCPKLRMLPPCPNVEDLELRGKNKMLSAASSTSSAPFSSSGFNLKRLQIDGDDKLESTERLVDIFATLSSLRSLTFRDCSELRSIAKGLENLTKLEELTIDDCEELDDEWEDEEGMPWKALNTTLRSLQLSRLPQLVGLPGGLQHLSNLRSLELSFNEELEDLPEWMSCLSSLESLELYDCPKLTSLPEAFSQLTNLNHLKIFDCPGLNARCQEGPNGSDWPKIQHIPHRHISLFDY